MKRLLAEKKYELDGLKYSDIMDVIWEIAKDNIERYFFDDMFYREINNATCNDDLEPISKNMAEYYIENESHSEFEPYVKELANSFYDVLEEEMEETGYIENGEYTNEK